MGLPRRTSRDPRKSSGSRVGAEGHGRLLRRRSGCTSRVFTKRCLLPSSPSARSHSLGPSPGSARRRLGPPPHKSLTKEGALTFSGTVPPLESVSGAGQREGGGDVILLDPGRGTPEGHRLKTSAVGFPSEIE